MDAKTGKEAWKTKLGDINKGETMTMAPLVVKGKVIVGNSGGEFGVRGWVVALDAKTGKVAWKAWSTGPDADCLIGPRFKPFYQQDVGKDLGVKTWPPDQWKIGGGNMWGWISYDPELNLIFHGTGNPAPGTPSSGRATTSGPAASSPATPTTGEAVWFYQWSPHDLYDHDGINENLLLDLPLGPEGALRKVLVRPERNGYVYVLDRKTGQVLSATPFVRITASKGVDLTTGKLIMNDEKKPVMGKTVRDIAPIAPGAKDWSPSAFSPRTGLIYMPSMTMSMDFEGVEVNYIAGTPYVGANVKTYADPVDPGDGSRGVFQAWDPIKKKPAWKIKEKFPVWSGAVATAGDVVFYGTMEGWFKAVDARTGKLLWQFKTGSGIIGQPVTYRGPDGKQYVAVLSGVGGWAGAVVAGDLDANDPTAALGFAGGMKDLPDHTTKGGTLYVFALPVMGTVMTIAWTRRRSAKALVTLVGTAGDPRAPFRLREPRTRAGCSAEASPPRVGRSEQPPVHQRQGGGVREQARRTGREGAGRRFAIHLEAQRRGFFREALKNNECDFVLGVPAGFERALTTAPYYRSTYVFVSRKDRDLKVKSFDDPALKTLKVGVQLIGDDGVNTPPAHALAARGIVDNVFGFTVYGDYAEANPVARVVDAVVGRDVDVAIVWGPLAGYFAKKHQGLAIAPVEPARDSTGLPMTFAIAMGVKKGDKPLRAEIDAILVRKKDEVGKVLDAYGIPRVPAPEPRK